MVGGSFTPDIRTEALTRSPLWYKLALVMSKDAPVMLLVTREVLAKVLRRYLSPRLATAAVEAVEKEAGKQPVKAVVVSETDQAAAIQALKRRGLR